MFALVGGMVYCVLSSKWQEENVLSVRVEVELAKATKGQPSMSRKCERVKGHKTIGSRKKNINFASVNINSYIWPDSYSYGTPTYTYKLNLERNVQGGLIIISPHYIAWSLNLSLEKSSKWLTLSLFSAAFLLSCNHCDFCIHVLFSRLLTWMIRLETHPLFFWSYKH